MDRVEAWTDGSVRGNGKVESYGGWAALLVCNGHEKELFGTESPSSNQRMELMAAIGALEALKRPCAVVLTTDSEYLKNGISEWIHRWKANGWKNSRKKPVLNQDLWVRLETAASRHTVTWKWTRGHADNLYNNRCDELAQAASAALKKAA